MKTTRKQLETLLQELAKQTNQTTFRQEAISKGLPSYLALDYASVYGGYRIVSVGVENGAHYGAFGDSSSCERIPANQMYNKLHTMLSVLEWSNRKQVNA